MLKTDGDHNLRISDQNNVTLLALLAAYVSLTDCLAIYAGSLVGRNYPNFATHLASHCK